MEPVRQERSRWGATRPAGFSRGLRARRPVRSLDVLSRSEKTARRSFVNTATPNAMDVHVGNHVTPRDSSARTALPVSARSCGVTPPAA